MPYTAYVRIENFHSPQMQLQFNAFRLWRIRQGDRRGLERLKEIFPGMPSTY
jgi:hypothetical protein